MRAELREERAPRAARAPRVVADGSVLAELPSQVTVKHGRYMTAEQVEWAVKLRDAGYGWKTIAKMLGGWTHSSMIATVRKTREAA